MANGGEKISPDCRMACNPAIFNTVKNSNIMVIDYQSVA
jgi:hypothetical protein